MSEKVHGYDQLAIIISNVGIFYNSLRLYSLCYHENGVILKVSLTFISNFTFDSIIHKYTWSYGLGFVMAKIWAS